jgi:hypothetical protein
LRNTTFELGALRGGVEPARGRGRHRVVHRAVDGLVDRLPARAAAEVRGERAIDVGAPALASRHERGRPHDDPGRAEAALRRAGRDEGIDEPVAQRCVETVERRDRPPGHALDRSNAGHARFPVDEDGANSHTALAVRSRPSRRRAQPLAQHVEQRFARFTLEVERSRRRTGNETR